MFFAMSFVAIEVYFEKYILLKTFCGHSCFLFSFFFFLRVRK